MINGITFEAQVMTSNDFAHFMYTFLNNSDGITKGCEISHSGSNVYVQKGYFIQYGRMVQILGSEEIESPEVTSGQLYCKVVFEIDLSKTNSEEEFGQGYFTTLYSETSYPSVTQEDLDNGGLVYQMPWCQYVKSSSGISNFKDLRNILSLENTWSAVAAQNQNYKAEFDEYFSSQKNVVESMIQELKDEGYLLMEDARETKEATFLKNGWSSTSPYTQTIAVSGVTSTDTPIPMFADDGTSETTSKEKKKSYGYISYFDSGTNSITAVCRYKKPTVDVKVVFKGV